MTQDTNALQNTDRIAVIGGGPSALFILKEFVERNNPAATLDIFETKGTFGTGMPYSEEGADPEHITNLSCEEIPDVVESVVSWLRRQPQGILAPYEIDPANVNEQAALPRLLFGQYLEDQFRQLTQIADERGLKVNLHPFTRVADVEDLPEEGGVKVTYGDREEVFDKLVIAIGHAWPKRHENEVEGYFDSPYPPRKLKDVFNHHVGLRGSSLTAIDAVKTLARTHGHFERREGGELTYIPNEGTENFKVVMHSRRGLLPCIRFHFDHPRVTRDLFVSDEALAQHRAENDGFVSLDFMFEKVFREPLREKDPAFYDEIKDMSLEQFIEHVFAMRTSENPFEFFADELGVSRISLEKKEPIHWKEMINFLSAAASASAKHMSAEDIMRLRKNFMPLASHIIAYIPHDSSEEMLAMHRAGKLDLIAVGSSNNLMVEQGVRGASVAFWNKDKEPEVRRYETFVDCVGQWQMPFEAFPFKTLIENGTVTKARLPFRSPTEAEIWLDILPVVETQNGYELDLPGLAIDDDLRVVGANGAANPRISIMSVPFIGGMNPDFSSLDFCEDAARMIMNSFESGINVVPPQPNGRPGCGPRLDLQ
jgi:hypothetical protein